ncbi:hypothetical protein IL38_23035 [Actinopolyspora erythraea]|nr:acyl carrier protein [Actinopolyspora erythraea]KGI79489.1 hypothetical protein IL38_23035 [Actinopolyspora erythraea]
MAGQDRESLEREIISLYANELDYPEEIVTADADLEADLGMESMERTDLFLQVAEKYDITEQVKGMEVRNYPTIGDIAALVAEHVT